MPLNDDDVQAADRNTDSLPVVVRAVSSENGGQCPLFTKIHLFYWRARSAHLSELADDDAHKHNCCCCIIILFDMAAGGIFRYTFTGEDGEVVPRDASYQRRHFVLK